MANDNDKDNKNLFKEVYTKENVAETLGTQNENVKTPVDDTDAGVPPSDSAIKKAQTGQETVIPDQRGRNSQLSDGDTEKEEYQAVHNDSSAPDYRDEIYKEKPVEGRIANQ